MKSAIVATFAVFAFAATAEAQEIVADTTYETYGEDVITLPLGVGLRVPSYDRVNGVSIPWGPKIRTPNGRIELDPTVTYRSHLGKVDPALSAKIAFGGFDSLTVFAGRGTFTNDGWIRSDLINSLAALGVGSDARNYFRADRVTAELAHSFRGEGFVIAPFVGGLHERDWSTGIHDDSTEGPWSIVGRTDRLRMRRVNPVIASGHVSSVLLGARGSYDRDQLKGSASVRLERSLKEPSSFDTDHFTQMTIDAKATFPTFGMQTFDFRAHALTTHTGDPPPQRFGYLGGAGTLSTVDLLALRGDRLVFVEGEYHIPLVRPLLPFVGAPVISLSYAAGSAGIGTLPDFIQNIGVGLGVKLVKVEYHIDPNYKKTAFSEKSAVTVGFSLSL
jgi:hypothetical protein